MKKIIMIYFCFLSISFANESGNVDPTNLPPLRPKILCLSSAQGYYGNPVLFYGFGQTVQIAANRSQFKCINRGFLGCFVQWCNPVL